MKTDPVERILEQMDAARLILSCARSIKTESPKIQEAIAVIEQKAELIERAGRVRLDGLIQATNKANIRVSDHPMQGIEDEQTRLGVAPEGKGA